MINLLSKKSKHALTLSAIIFSQVSFATTEWLDGITAIVEDDVVLNSEMTQRINSVKKNISKSKMKAPSEAELRKNILDQLIAESIQLQMAKRAGVRISDQQLNKAIENIAARNRMSLEQFQQAIVADGLSYQALREQIKKEMLLQRVQQGNVSRRVVITDQEVQNYLASAKDIKVTSPDYRILHVLIPLSESASSSEKSAAKQKAQRLFQALNQSGDFVSAAKGQGYESNDLGWRNEKDLPSLLTDIVPNMRRGEVSQPFTSSSGFHIIKLAEKRGDNKTISQTKVRHILVKTSAILDDQQAKQKLEDVRRRIQQGEDFAVLAKQFSEDIGSASEGGELGWANPGQFVPEFELAMGNTQVKQLSPVFRSEFGWHLLEVQDRRSKDVTNKVKENIAKNAIFQRKFNDELAVWLQKIRDEAYVDIK